MKDNTIAKNHTNNFLKCFGNNPKNKLGDKMKENETE